MSSAAIRWNTYMDAALLAAYLAGDSYADMAQRFRRSERAIGQRLQILRRKDPSLPMRTAYYPQGKGIKGAPCEPLAGPADSDVAHVQACLAEGGFPDYSKRRAA
jgi:hypothetical protein